MSWWESFKTSFRKHDYNLGNPDVEVCDNIRLDGIPLRYVSYRCTRCGNVLALNLSQMQHLPLPLSHGCPGQRVEEHSRALLT